MGDMKGGSARDMRFDPMLSSPLPVLSLP